MLWERYIKQEPRGESRMDWQFASLSKLVSDIAVGLGGKANPMQVSDYLLKFEEITPESQRERLLNNLRAIFGSKIPKVSP